jgi:hypothetical protein
MNIKNAAQFLGIIALAAVIGFSVAGCDGSGGGDLDLSGIITITPDGTAYVNDLLTANYTGTETVSYQWKRGDSNISGATEITYTPNEAGSYTVTVSAEGFNSKTSAVITVISLSVLTGDINITPAGPVTAGTMLTANYSGTETVSYQWRRNLTNIGTNSATYTPDEAGYYSVFISATGFIGKASSDVIVTEPMPGTSSTLAMKLTWVRNANNVQSGQTYTFEVSADESIAPQTLSYTNRSNITIVLKGTETERTISLSSNGAMFTVGSGVKLVLDENITLQGKSDNNNSLVMVNSNGALEMREGTKITGNTASLSNSPSYGGGVYVSGTFTMTGGEITGNTASHPNNHSASHSSGGGVFVSENGIFSMSNGKITGNTAIVNSTRVTFDSYGGGVCVIGTFTMTGGEISGNTSSSNSYISLGGGVYVSGTGTFTMTNGEIFGNNANSTPISFGGGVCVFGTFRVVTGTVYGSNESSTSLKNTATQGAALNIRISSSVGSAGTAQYGTFSNPNDITSEWTSAGDFIISGIYTNNTIKVVNGVLEQ